MAAPAINAELLEELLDAPFKKEDPRPPPSQKNGSSSKKPRSPSKSPSRSPSSPDSKSRKGDDNRSPSRSPSRERKDKERSRSEKSKDGGRDKDKDRKSSKRRDRSRSRDRSSRAVRSSSKDRKDKDRKKEKSSRRKRSRSVESREKSSRRKRSRSGIREKSSRRKRSRSDESRERRRKRSRSRSVSVGSAKDKSGRKRSRSRSVEDKRSRRSPSAQQKQVSEPAAAVAAPPLRPPPAAPSPPVGNRRRSPSIESAKRMRGSPSPARKETKKGSPPRDPRRRRYDSPSPDRRRRGGRSPPAVSNLDRDRDRDGDKERNQDDRGEREREVPAIWRPTPPSPNLSEYERNRRTVFVMQLAKGLKNRELAEFFLQAGNVRDVRIISDKNSRRSKGVGYVEFFDEASVPPALQMSGQKLLGVPIIVQPTEAEKNAVAKDTASEMGEISNKLFVGQLHFSLTEEDIKLVFEPFGPIDFVNIVREPDTGHSRGYGFIQYRNAEDAKRAREKMNSFEIAGRPIKVGLVTDKSMTSTGTSYNNMNLDDGDTAGLPLTQKGRQELMAKLAREEPRGGSRPLPPPPRPAVPIIMPTRCVLLKNMFDPAEETEPNWSREIEEDVRDECSQFGKVLHIHLEPNSEGHVYLKFESVNAAQAAITALNGRFFARRQILAVFVTDAIYNAEFPAAAKL
ncbi:hypothetical protein BJ742DRAFT_803088 [Cladochytrium replicatum]|nr:hypothetical protein BJ742DRAFT_803088 [Cladochytrium replicatum]